ncbi:MAG: VCBS repeat-containing protein, partial [Planctomycetes bacterium]|nr:VCBS repeat-containing protein [Planctomycetota bacterium]
MRTIAALLVSVCVAQSAPAGGEFPGRSLFLGQGANAVEVADIDLDGDLDALVLDALGRQLHALVGDGSGALTVAGSTLVGSNPSTDTPSTLALGDFDGDGRVDAAIGHPFADKVTIVRNLGNASFSVFGTLTFVASPSAPISQLHCAELDADGRTDLVIVRNAGIYVSLAQPGFGLGSPTLAVAIPSTTISVASRDFDGDGAAELLVGTVGPALQLYANDGNAVFAASWSSPTNAFDTQALALADIDGDGDDDVVRVGEFDEPVVLRGDGSGAFVDPTALPTASFSVRVE